MHQLSVKVMTVATGLFGAVMFVVCVAYGLLVPALHNAALLEAVLPWFRWLTPGSVVIGVAETFLYGALAGLVFTSIYNAVSRWQFGRRAAHHWAARHTRRSRHVSKRASDGAMLPVMFRTVSLVIVLLAVLAPPLDMATAHCLEGGCEGFCISAIAPAPTIVVAADMLAFATDDRSPSLLSSPLRLSEPPPRPLRTTV
jgi:hypothetical protein